MSTDWLVAAIVLVPVLSAVLPVALSLRYDDVGWPIAAVVVASTFAMAVATAAHVRENGAIAYLVAGIARPFGVELYVDEFSMLVVLLVLAICLGVLVFTRIGGPRGNSFYAGFLLLTGGMLGVVITGDIFNLYVFLEIMAISSYALVASSKYRWSTYAAFKYLLVGTVGASFYLMGVALTFAATGTLNMQDLAVRIPEAGYADPVVITAFVLMAVGLAIKIALFPVHTWLADAHASAPDGISAVISALMPAVAVYAFARITFTVFTPEFLTVNPVISQVILIGALLSLFAGSFFALMQDHIKLVLAYSTVSQFGLILIGIGIANETALFGSMLHIFGHGIVKASLFILAGMFALRFGGIRMVDEYAGLAKRAPVMAGAFAVLGITMIGLPPTVGFAGKWYIALGAFEEGLWAVSALVLLSSLLTAGYILPFINRLYFHPFAGEDIDRESITTGMLIAVSLGATLGLTLGFFSSEMQLLIQGAIDAMLVTS